MTVVIEDELVGLDDLQDKIAEDEDHVQVCDPFFAPSLFLSLCPDPPSPFFSPCSQSSDVAAMQKL